MFRFRNGLLSSVFSTGAWATGTSQTARTANPPAAKINARKTREVRSFDMCAFFFFYRALFCSFEYAPNTCVFSTHLAVFGSGFPLYVLAFICSQNELKHPTKVYTIKLVMFYVATCHKSIIFFIKV